MKTIRACKFVSRADDEVGPHPYSDEKSIDMRQHSMIAEVARAVTGIDRDHQAYDGDDTPHIILAAAEGEDEKDPHFPMCGFLGTSPRAERRCHAIWRRCNPVFAAWNK
jgi:hypothetical protein